jgi:hypothetical protein
LQTYLVLKTLTTPDSQGVEQLNKHLLVTSSPENAAEASPCPLVSFADLLGAEDPADARQAGPGAAKQSSVGDLIPLFMLPLAPSPGSLMPSAQIYLVLKTLKTPDKQGVEQPPMRAAAFRGDSGRESISTWDAAK